MIVYDKLWETMKKKGISQYRLLKEYKFSSGQLDRLRKRENVSTYTLDQLCKILHCHIEDIVEYIEDK
ncbi:MAG: helix-turn-helix transcriptional regulator [Oscillospiraceae bacterium]|nr:helix-turn-helix transcriptional regulator [Oscillospiraceae bacterium]